MRRATPKIKILLSIIALLATPIYGKPMEKAEIPPPLPIKKTNLSDAEWKKKLSPQQFRILRQGSTEVAYSSPLNDEHRNGIYICAGCELPLFTSEMKYDSGTGWPSFFDSIKGHIETKKDWSHVFPRTEYHCARCGGHQGHLSKDGPKPTGLRYCNNGLALKFVPKEKEKAK
jgi:peptide-methionine (R)-S-oxide reductase